MKKKIVAMLLAGGQGSRLGVLTSKVAKPAVPYGGKFRIIDFPLSNCVNSGIDTVGVLTQYRPLALNSYLGTGQHWDLDRMNGGVYVLPPYMTGEEGRWYSGTANAIWQNREFIDQYDPDYVLILSGDHIYKMDYADMLRQHEARKATATIAVKPVPWEEASRFGIMSTDGEGRIVKFSEKPKQPDSNLASMGIYIFNWKALRDTMEADDAQDTDHDFGKNIIPAMLGANEPMFAYSFDSYWKDVGTISSLWEANMDLLETPPKIQLNDPYWRIYTRDTTKPPLYVGTGVTVSNSLVTEGSVIYGDVNHSVIFGGVHIGKGAVVRDSVIFPGARIGAGTVVDKAILGENAVVGDNCVVGGEVREGDVVDNKLTGDITLIGNDISVPANSYLPKGTVVQHSVEEGEMA